MTHLDHILTRKAEAHQLAVTAEPGPRAARKRDVEVGELAEQDLVLGEVEVVIKVTVLDRLISSP